MPMRYYKKQYSPSPQCLVCGKAAERHHILGGSFRQIVGDDKRGTIWLCPEHHRQVQGTTIDNIIECLAWKLLYDTPNCDPVYVLGIYRPRAKHVWVWWACRKIYKRARELALLEGLSVYNVPRIPLLRGKVRQKPTQRRRIMRVYINMLLNLMVEAWKNLPKDWTDKEAVQKLFREIADELAEIICAIVASQIDFGSKEVIEDEVKAVVAEAKLDSVIPPDVIAAIVRIIVWILSMIPK